MTNKNTIPSQAHKNKLKSYTLGQNLCLRRKVLFSILKNVPNYISERNGSAEVEVNNSNGTFVCDGDAHKVVLCPRSPFFCMRWVLLRSKKPIEDNP